MKLKSLATFVALAIGLVGCGTWNSSSYGCSGTFSTKK
jgi:hypothetical protein